MRIARRLILVVGAIGTATAAEHVAIEGRVGRDLRRAVELRGHASSTSAERSNGR